MEDWRLGDIDYSYKGAGEAGEGNSTGRMIITPHAAQGPSDAITRHMRHSGIMRRCVPAVECHCRESKGASVLSQNMSGLNEAFSARIRQYPSLYSG